MLAMPPYLALNPWQQQQQLAMRSFQAYEPWAVPLYQTTSSEKFSPAMVNNLTGAECKWEGYEKTERIIRDIQVSMHLSTCQFARCNLIRKSQYLVEVGCLLAGTAISLKTSEGCLCIPGDQQ